VQPAAPDDNHLRPYDGFNYQRVGSLATLPHPPTVSRFGSFERLPVSAGSSDLQPTALSPGRAAGYSALSLNELQMNGHTEHHSQTERNVARANGHDQMQSGKSSSNHLPIVSASSSVLSPASSTPHDLPPYTDTRSKFSSSSRPEQREETLPPYSAPPQQQQHHPHLHLYTNANTPRATSPHDLGVEVTSPDFSNSNSSPGVLTTTYGSEEETGTTGRFEYTPFASSELLPLSTSQILDRNAR
jgi:hypothetical protein